jgi:heme A synthase
VSLIFTAAALLVGWWLVRNWSDFYTDAHGYAATIMFVFLIFAIIAVVWEHRKKRDNVWFWFYTAVAALMILGGILIPTTRIFGEHSVFALEAYEIVLFGVYWGIQTAEKWGQPVECESYPSPSRPSPPP